MLVQLRVVVAVAVRDALVMEHHALQLLLTPLLLPRVGDWYTYIAISVLVRSAFLRTNACSAEQSCLLLAESQTSMGVQKASLA